MEKLRVLFVCMGNICRSPTAEAVLRHKLQERGLDAQVEVASAGTHDWHAGAPPDERAQAHARQRGYDLSALRARGVEAADLERYDIVLAMDDDNLDQLRAMCPPALHGRIARLMTHARRRRGRAVPDPYGKGAKDFEKALDLIEEACNGLVDALADRLRG